MAIAKKAVRKPVSQPKKQLIDPLAVDYDGDMAMAYDWEELSPRLAQIRADLGLDDSFDASVFVYKLVQGVKSPPQVWSGPPDHYDMRAIAREHGSGEYRYILYLRDRDGNKARRLNETISIQLSPPELRAYNLAMAEAEHPELTRPAGGGLADLQTMMAGMMAGFQETIKAISPPPRDQMAEFLKFSEMMRAIAPAPAPAGPSFAETLALVKTFQDAVGANQSGGQDAGPAVLLKAIDAFGGPLAEGLKRSAPPAAQLSAGIDSEDQITEEEESMLMLKLQLNQACRTAAGGENPADYADKIYSILPDEAFALLMADDWFSKLVTVAPACAGYQPWFHEVRAALMQIGQAEGDLSIASDGVARIVPTDGGVRIVPIDGTLKAHPVIKGVSGNPSGIKPPH